MAAFTWASTLCISSYWMHPGALSAFSVSEVAWMAISPIAMTSAVIGAAMTVGRLDLSLRVLRYEAALGAVATITMVGFLVGACYWLVDGGTGPRNLFHLGTIDVIEVVMMAVALIVALRAVHRSRSGGLARPAG
jgi:hypothetical protein